MSKKELENNELTKVSGGFLTITPYAGGKKSGESKLYKINSLSEAEKRCLLEADLCELDEAGNIVKVTDDAKAIKLLRDNGFEEKEISASVMKRKF